MMTFVMFTEVTLLLVEVLLIQSKARLGYTYYEKDLHLIVGLPLEQDREPAASWERGKEILTGAQIAVDNINNRSDILPGYKLHTVVINIGVENDNFLLQVINLTYYQNYTTFIGAVGIFCPPEVQTVTQLPDKFNDNVSVAKTKEDIKLIIEATNGCEFGKHNIRVSKMVNALLDFLEVMEWRNVAAIIDPKDISYFSHFVELLHSASNKNTSNITITAVEYNYAQNISYLNLSRITIISVNEHLLKEILCNAHKQDMMWPKHVWILHTYHLQDFKFNRISCTIEVVLENVIILNEEVPTQFTEMLEYNEKQLSKFDLNSYSVILHNLVWSVALQVNETLQDQFRTANNSLPNQFLKKQIAISQVRNFTEIPVAQYQPDKLTLNFTDLSFKVNAPSDELLIITIGGSVVYTVVFVTEIVAFFTFVTIMLSCYSCFRREPEVRATSFSLSLLTFLGCYIMFLYLSLLLYFNQPLSVADETLNGLCISLNWFSGLGISSGLLLTTALVKILRIYYIFTKRSATRLSKRCSDTYLALYVLLILMPLIFIHALWTILDPYIGSLKISSELDIIQIQKQCSSKYAMLWYALLMAYMSTIFITLLVVAIKTRRIKKSHFKDTKKVTILVIFYFVDVAVTLAFWRILYTNVNAYYAAVVLHIGHIIAILLYQLLLFAPKVLPPFARYISKRHSSK